jgi:hypothetical protein
MRGVSQALGPGTRISETCHSHDPLVGHEMLSASSLRGSDRPYPALSVSTTVHHVFNSFDISLLSSPV